jgi:hypothetical protein
MRHRRGQPAPHVQHHPTVLGVGLHGLDQQVMVDAVEEGPDVQIEHPVLTPTSSPGHRHCVQRRPAGPVPVGVGVEHRFHPGLQPGRDHGLGDPVRNSRHTQHPDLAVRLRDRHRTHRWREVGPRGHPIPDLVQVAPQIGLEVLQAHPVHPRRALVRLHPLIGLPHLPLGDLERLRLRQ